MPRSVTVRDVQGVAIPLAQEGTDGSGITPPSGGSGARGWLSGIYRALSGALAVSVTNSTASPVNVAGTVSVSSAPSTPVYTNPPTSAPVTPAPATLTAGQDNTVALAQTCKKYFIQNNTSQLLHYTIDGTAAGLGSPAIAAGGAYRADDMIVSAVHLYPEGTGTVALNTTATPGIWVQAGA